MKVAKGEIVTINGEEATVTKVSALPRGIIDGESKPGQVKVTPMYRIYWSIGKRKGHTDAVLTDGIEVACG
jgi:hypothetical protein